MYVCNITELNIQLNQILNDKIKKYEFNKGKKKQQINSSESLKLELIPQIHSMLNSKLKVNQEDQFSVEA